MPVGSESTDYSEMHPPTHLDGPIGLLTWKQVPGHLSILAEEWICVRLFEKTMGKGRLEGSLGGGCWNVGQTSGPVN